jgi:ADP-dependent NAD(P)H-hydrate dehydratase / NAD(P)H-hydrate epimerase
MTKIVSTAQMREIEAAADASGLSYAQLMQNAGRAAAERAKAMLAALAVTEPKVTVLVGPGNNGGDALVTGLLLSRETDAKVRFYLTRTRGDEDENWAAVRDSGTFVALADDDQRFRVLTNLVASAALVIDGLYGIGTKPPLRPDAAPLLRAVRAALREYRGETTQYDAFLSTPDSPPMRRGFRPRVLALDCPSGIDCDTGAADNNTIPADETITFIAAKTGLLSFPAAAYVGRLVTTGLGVPPGTSHLRAAQARLASGLEASEALPARPLDGHKGTFGRVLVVGGSEGYIGAPLLAGRAAYRVGAGLVQLAVPESHLAHAASFAEAVWLPLGHGESAGAAAASAQAVLIGPGLSSSDDAAAVLQAVLAMGDALPALVLDADALNVIASGKVSMADVPPDAVLTPHPGEMARLLGKTTDEINADRIEITRSAAQTWGKIVVLKGAHTVTASPSGEVVVSPFRQPALAKAGTGDVLAGMIAGLAAQGTEPFTAAWLGVYVHGLAGTITAERSSARSVIASDVLDALSDALSALEPS